jgi:protocatechuate 4,5-dioxygenase beta chain
MLIDHATSLPLELLWPDNACPVRIVPVGINTVLFPVPSALRCFRLGQTIGHAIRNWDSDARVLIIGTGGLSHQLEGERAGFINAEFDQVFMSKLADDPLWATRYSGPELVELTGTQGIELLNWLAMRGALTGNVKLIHSNYHIPISNTATGLVVLENA